MEKSSNEDAYNIELTEGNLLGEGSYGQVYKIKRKIDGLTCAAKLFKIPLHQMDTNEQLGYKRESKILKQADHPFIIQFIEEFPYKQRNLCIVTKFASGGDLEKFMRKQQKFTEDEALEYFAMLLLGLDFLHSKNIFHRDLKPGNIFINELSNGKKLLCIGDFGISKYDLDTIKQTQTTLGYNTTPLYKAPEVINMQEPTSKVDMWAAGIILYQLLAASKHPFKKNEFIQTLLSIRDLDYDPLPENISPSTKKLVALLLQKNPDSRPDAKSILQMDEMKVVVERLLQKICVTERKIAAKLIDEHKITWISPDLMKQDQVQLALEALAKLQLQLLSQNCQNKEQIIAAINQLRSDKIFDDSSEEEVSVLLQKISGTKDILLEIATSLKGKIQSLEYAQSLKDQEIAKLKEQVRDLQSKIGEEEKESPAQKESSPFQLSKAHPCFDFYNNLESLNISDLQFKKDYKYTIRHPYWQINPPKPIEDIPQVEVTLKMCTLQKAKPYGLVHIQYTDNSSKFYSFDGVGVFSEGQLHMGPFTCITGDGWGLSYSLMMNGRPADKHYYTQFYPEGSSNYVDSLKTVTNVSGSQFCSTQYQQGLYHGYGKIWLTKARMFIGDFQFARMNEGKLYELQKDNTFSLYQVVYNPQADIKLGKNVHSQEPIEKNLISAGHIDLSDLSKKKAEGIQETLWMNLRNKLRS